MFKFKTDIKKSNISNYGLFAGEIIPKGEIISIFVDEDTTITHIDNIVPSEHFNRTACRWVEDYFISSDEITRDSYINHSFSPNMLYFFGVCFANKDIPKGEELTIDYSFLIHPEETFSLIDNKTKRKVDGLSNINYYVRSILELGKLINE
jgi:SET domain-containing protein